MLRIAEAREARGWTQEQLAQAVGTTQQTIQRWESGQVDPKVSRVEDISRALGITMSFLLGIDLGEDARASDVGDGDRSMGADERELLALYRRMSPDMQRTIIETARNFAALRGVDERDRERDAREVLIG